MSSYKSKWVDGNAEYGVAMTRLWPTFLIPALMGPTTMLRTSIMESDPSLIDRVLPSQRFLALLGWWRRANLGRDLEPLDLWPRVEQACQDLFGWSVVESMEIDVAAHAEMVDRLAAQGVTPATYHGLLDARFLLNRRKEALRILLDRPMTIVDPLAYGAAHEARREFTPDWMLLHRSGFRDDAIPSEMSPLDSLLVGPSAPLYVGPSVEDADARAFAAEDEI